MALGGTQISLAELREQLGKIVQEASKRGKRYFITNHSKAEAVLVGLLEWEKMNETMSILSNQELMTQIQASLAEIEAGDVEEADAVFDEIMRECPDDE